MAIMTIDEPNEKQKLALIDTHKKVGYGGARGGGKSWFVRTKAKLLAVRYSGIKILIVRRTYPELRDNHINPLKEDLVPQFAKYNDKEKEFKFKNGSKISFTYCSCDGDLSKFQGQEYDIIFLDEATQLSEYQVKQITATNRGVNDFPKRIYYTCNPGGQGHAYFKRIFIDKKYIKGEKPEDYSFIQALVTDNVALMNSQPDYVDELKALPEKLKKMWLEGRWDVAEGMFFEDFRDNPDGYETHKWSHVIKPFEIPSEWNITRSYDFGYGKPFSCAWWAYSPEGVAYRILEYYGCTQEPNEGVKYDPDTQFKKIREIEVTHPYLKGKHIDGVADPAIWDASRGESVAETAAKYGIYFQPGDNKRIAGWMQVHYRLTFDKNGYAKMYFFDNCKAAIRTMPMMMYSKNNPEDLDTNMEDHCCDEIRYYCMTRPIRPVIPDKNYKPQEDPLELYKNY